MSNSVGDGLGFASYSKCEGSPGGPEPPIAARSSPDANPRRESWTTWILRLSPLLRLVVLMIRCSPLGALPSFPPRGGNTSSMSDMVIQYNKIINGVVQPILQSATISENR